MRELDLREYAGAFGAVHGAFTMDAALLFFAYESVVWEGICWLRDRGNPPARVVLEVR